LRKYILTPNSSGYIRVNLNDNDQRKINILTNKNLDIIKDRNEIFKIMIDYFDENQDLLRKLLMENKQ